MIATSGVWLVKKGREDDFVRRWEESAGNLSLEFPGVTFRLLRDHENPQRFVTLGEGWRNHEQVEAASGLPAFQDAMASIWRLLDEGHISTLELVVEVS